MASTDATRRTGGDEDEAGVEGAAAAAEGGADGGGEVHRDGSAPPTREGGGGEGEGKEKEVGEVRACSLSFRFDRSACTRREKSGDVRGGRFLGGVAVGTWQQSAAGSFSSPFFIFDRWTNPLERTIKRPEGTHCSAGRKTCPLSVCFVFHALRAGSCGRKSRAVSTLGWRGRAE